MVRVNLINPHHLADQHLVAEYNELLMLAGYVRRYPSVENIPVSYTLGRGHINFFKNKMRYIQNRHGLLRKEMRKRGFATNKKVNLSSFREQHLNDWKPEEKDIQTIKERIISKLEKKPSYYRHYGKKKTLQEHINRIKRA